MKVHQTKRPKIKPATKASARITTMSKIFLSKLNKKQPHKKIFLLSISFILLGCSFNDQKSSAPIYKNEVKPSSIIENIFSKDPALSPIWSKNGELVPKTFSEVPKWSNENFFGVWQAWKKNCKAMSIKNLLFRKICRKSKKINPLKYEEIKKFFEANFTPHEIKSSPNTITGYYEPILRGSLKLSKRFIHPLYRKPDDLIIKRILRDGQATGKWFHGKKISTLSGETLIPYPSRKELYGSEYLKKFEIIYLEDPIDAFFLQIQGSGRIELENKSVIRLGFSASNGHPYRSIGTWLIKNGELSASSASMQGIKNWLRKNPSRQNELLNQNPRMIFFKDLTSVMKSDDGPVGSLGVSLTAGRSIAVDTDYISLGLPVFLATTVPKSEANSKSTVTNGARLVFAQDTGKAIKGPNRGDLFFGSGVSAGNQAGRMKYSGTMTILVPNQ